MGLQRVRHNEVTNTLSTNKETAGFPGGSVVKESACNAGDSPWGRETIRHNLVADERTTK